MIAITISYQEIWDVKFDYNTLLPRDCDDRDKSWRWHSDFKYDSFVSTPYFIQFKICPIVYS